MKSVYHGVGWSAQSYEVISTLGKFRAPIFRRFFAVSEIMATFAPVFNKHQLSHSLLPGELIPQTGCY